MTESFGSYSGRSEEFFIAQAVKEIEDQYGDEVSVENKMKSLFKFGFNPNVGTTDATLWYTGKDVANENLVYRNIITTMSSNNAADLNDSYWEGHYFGDDIEVSSITRSGSIVTVTTSTSHGFETDEYVNIEGASETEYNGIKKITVTGSTTFTYTISSTPTTPATGTITTNHLRGTFHPQTKTKNGQNKVVFDQALARVTRHRIPKQTDAVINVGELYAYEDPNNDEVLTSGKPDDTTKIHLTVPAGRPESQKAATFISHTDYWILSKFTARYLEKTGTNVAEVNLEYKEIGGV